MFRHLFTISSGTTWLFLATHQNNISTCAKTVILKSVSAQAILMCYKTQSKTPWRWRRQTTKHVGGKKRL